MTYSKILGTGSYLPEKIITNADLEKMVETSDEWIMKRVGIRERHIVDKNETTSSMAAIAARCALEASGLTSKDIGMVIVATASGDYFFPGVACMVQDALGIEHECGSFDVNAACAGFIYGVSIADQYIRNNEINNVLVVGVDTLSTFVDWKDRSTCVLFGDGAGAIVLQASDEPGVLATEIKAAGKYSQLLYAKSSLWYEEDDAGILRMDGHEVFKVAVIKLNEIIDQILMKAGVDRSEINWLVPHQANLRIITAVMKRLGIPIEKAVLTIEKHGNTSAASIPLALDDAIQKGRIKRGENLLLEAFGAGFTWGAALVKY